MIRTMGLDKETQLRLVEDQRIEVEPPQVMARWLRDMPPTVRPGPPGMVEPPPVSCCVSTAVRNAELEARELVENPLEDEVRDGDRGVDRVAEQVVEIVI